MILYMRKGGFYNVNPVRYRSSETVPMRDSIILEDLEVNGSNLSHYYETLELFSPFTMESIKKINGNGKIIVYRKYEDTYYELFNNSGNDMTNTNSYVLNNEFQYEEIDNLDPTQSNMLTEPSTPSAPIPSKNLPTPKDILCVYVSPTT